MNEIRLTPEQARARFGELTAPAGRGRVHVHFDTPEGEWRPEFDADVKLTGYRLYPGPKKAARKVVWRPKGKL